MVDGPKPLIFSDEPDKQYYAIPNGDAATKRFLTIGYGVISFLCPDPYAYEVEQTVQPTGAGLTAIDNTGKAPADPIITLPFTGDATFVRASIDDVSVLVGQPAQADVTTVPTSRVELWDDLTSTSGWSEGVNAQDGTVVGPLDSNGSSFYASSTGSGAQWHGCTSRRAIANLSDKFSAEALVKLDNRVWDTVTNEGATLNDADWNALSKASINGDQVANIVVTHATTGYVYTTAHDYDISVDVEGVTRIRRQTGSNIGNGQTVHVSYRYRKAKSGRCELYLLDENGSRIGRIGVSDASEDTVSTKFYASVWHNGEATTICGEYMGSDYEAFNGIMRLSCNGAGKWTAYFAKRNPDTGALSAARSWSVSNQAATNPLAAVELHVASYGTIPAATPMRHDHVRVVSHTEPAAATPTIIARAGETIVIDCEAAEIRAGVSGELRMDLLNITSDDFPHLPAGPSVLSIETDGSVSGATIAYKRRWC